MNKNKNSRIILAVITIIAITLTLTMSAWADDFKELEVGDYKGSSQEDGYTNFDENGEATKNVEVPSSNEVSKTSSEKPADGEKKTEGKSGKVEGRSASAPEAMIELNKNEILILGENNKYIVKIQTGGTANLKVPPISPGDWSDDPNDWDQGDWTKVLRAGEYDENSVVLLNDALESYHYGIYIYAIPEVSSVGSPVTLKQIRMQATSVSGTRLLLIPGTHLNLKYTGSGAAVDFSAVPSSPSPLYTPNELVINENTTLTVEASEQALNLAGPVTINTGGSIGLKTTQVSAKEAVKVKGLSLSGDLSLDSNTTTYGIYDESSLKVFANGNINITINSGVAYSGYLDTHFSNSGKVSNFINKGDGKGIEIRGGKPGNPNLVHISGAGSTVNVSVAGTGIGIDTSLGSVQISDSTINVDVNEGVGIYAKNNIHQFSGTMANGITSKVNKGIAAIAGNMSTSPDAKGIFTFESSGESENLGTILPLPGRTIPKTAGFVLLDGQLSIAKSNKLIAKSPKDILGSFGIVTAPSASEPQAYMPPTINISLDSTLEATGYIGIDSINAYLSGTINIDSVKHDIVSEMLMLNKTTVVGGELTGEQSAIKLRNQDPSTINTGNYEAKAISLLIYDLPSLKIKGGDYGIEGINTAPIDWNDPIEIEYSNIEVESTNPGSTAFSIIENDPAKTLFATIKGSDITVNGVKDGIRFENFNKINFISGANEKFLKSTADEVAIHMTTVNGTTIKNNYKIHGISRKTTPDETGKKAAIYFGDQAGALEVIDATSGKPKIIEEYTTKATKVINTTPYMHYAADRNIPIGNGIWNDPANWSFTETRQDITTSSTGLSTNASVGGALVVGNMRGTDAGARIKFAADMGSYEIITHADLNKMTITFDTDGGTPIPNPQSAYLNDLVVKPTDPAKDGHTFLHWQEENTTGAFDFTSPITTLGDKKLVAQWDKLKYTLTYVQNTINPAQVIVNMPSPLTQTLEYGDKIVKPVPDPTTVKNTFLGWTTDKEGTTPYDFDTLTTKNVTLYAHWDPEMFTVTYEMNNGTPAVNPETIPYQSFLTKPGDPTRTGYTFKGWTTTDGGTTNWNFTTGRIEDHMTLYAKWEALPFTVTFEVNGGTPAIPAKTVLYDDKITGVPTLTKIGHTFVNWTTDSAGSKVWDLAVNVVKGNVKLYAQWSVNSYDVTYNMNGGTPVIPVASVKYNTKITKPADPTRAGFKFINWTKDPAGKTPWNFDSLMPANNVDLYAQWERLGFLLTYDSMGGIPEKQEKNFQFEEKITTPPKEPTKRLFKFVGWYKDKAFTQAVIFGTDQMPDKPMTIYAKWERTHYEVFFDINGGNKATEPKTMAVEIGKEADIKAFQPGGKSAPSFKGNFFLGWTDEAGNKIISNPTIVDKDIKLKANWISIDGLINYTGPNSIVGYKNEIKDTEINNTLTITGGYTDFLGNTVEVNVLKEWDKNIISLGGVEKVNLYVIDNVGGKIPVGVDIHIYILNRAYITGRDFVSFNLYDRPKVNGGDWSVKAYKELPDFAGKTISRLPMRVEYNENGFTTELAGMYNPFFTSDDVDYFGKKIALVKRVTAYVSIGPDMTEVINTTKETEFWIEVSKTLHLSQKRESWHLDGKSYKAGPSKFENLRDIKAYDRKVIADPMSFLDMSAEALQVLKEQDNSRLEVKMNILTWYFDSEDFKDDKTQPTGFFPLEVNNYTTNKDLVNAGKNGNSMQLHFEMNKYWQGWATLEVDLSKALLESGKKGNSIYMFNFNEDTKELELIGRMKPSGESRYSIKLNGVFKDYIIMDHLPGGSPKANSGKTVKLIPGKQVERPISYRITELTNPLEDDVKTEINRNLQSSGKTIDQITLVQPETTEKSNGIKLPIIIALSVIIVVGLALLIVFIIRRKRENEYENQGYYN